MKKNIAFIYILLISLSLFSCKDYDKNEAFFGDDDLPLIFVEGWAKPMNVKVGDSINIAPLVSPSNGVNYVWTFGDERISTDRILKYKVGSLPGTYRLQFLVDRNGVLNSYFGDVNVAE